MKLSNDLLMEVFEKEIEIEQAEIICSRKFNHCTICQVNKELVNKARWRATYFIIYCLVFDESSVEYWGCHFEEPNTEDCDAEYFNPDKDNFVPLTEMEAYEKVIKGYKIKE